jgi:DNA-binding transcriptional MerR regulator
MKSDGQLVGDVAKSCAVSVDTIRHYERKGVIPAALRDDNGYRRYPDGTADRVRIVRRALEIGFSLEELSGILRERAAGQPPCRKVRSLAVEKLDELDARIASLLHLRETLASILTTWDRQLDATPAGGMSHLLDSHRLTGGLCVHYCITRRPHAPCQPFHRPRIVSAV